MSFVMPTSEFKIGDKVVYPNHGIGVVETIQHRHIAGRDEACYTLRILSNDSTVMVPCPTSRRWASVPC